MFQTV